MEETLDQLEFIWSILLLTASVILNVTAFLILLSFAGSCYKDPIVPPLLSIIGCNILHTVLVQIFSVHQQSHQSFIFSADVCKLVFTNRDILVDVPFFTISMQIIATLRNVIQKTNPSYSHCGVCSKQLLVVFLPWIIAIFINIVIKQVPSGIIFNSACVPMLPPEMEDYIIHWSISLISPVIIIIIAFIISIPRSITNRICNRIGKHKQDITLLSVLFLSYIILQVPARILEWAVQYNDASDHGDLISLITLIIFNLPLVINPMGVIIIRRNKYYINNSSKSFDNVFESDENITLMVSMEGKDLENALFAAKTTTL